jgi:hypothetical protein
MGTRSLTFVYDEDNTPEFVSTGLASMFTGSPLVCMYRQMDGYPTGHGRDLFYFLSGGTVVGGLTRRETEKVQFNGAGCLAAALVARFKTGPGGVYLEPVDTADAGQEYEYHIGVDPAPKAGAPHGSVRVVVFEHWHSTGRMNPPLFAGTVDEFGLWIDEVARRETNGE